MNFLCEATKEEIGDSNPWIYELGGISTRRMEEGKEGRKKKKKGKVVNFVYREE